MSKIWLDILVIGLLLILNGILAMTETALLSARKARLQHRLNEGDRLAQKAMQLIDNPNRFLSTIQIGITMIDILVGAIGGSAASEFLVGILAQVPALRPYGSAISLFLVVVMITYFSIVIGELVPKRIAIQNPERVASLSARPMIFLGKLVSPFVYVLGKSTDLILHLLRIKHTDEPPVTEEELLVQLDQGTQAGVFDESEQDMVEGVLSLSDQRVNALMTPRNEIIWLDVGDTAVVIRGKIENSPFSRFPVGDGSLDNLVGVVKAKDVLLVELKNGRQLKELARPPLFVPETAFGSRALEILKESKREMIMVVDEFGIVQGLLTLADILEEIVGEFEGEPQATQRQDGSWLLDGMLPNDEFKELFNLRRLPDEEEYETLGGFVLLQFGRIPKSADVFEWGGMSFEVMDMDGNRVDKVLVTTLPIRQVEKSEK